MAITGRRAVLAGAAVLVVGAAAYGLLRPSSQSVGPRIGQSAPPYPVFSFQVPPDTISPSS